MNFASGPFDVKLAPQPTPYDATTTRMGRMSIDKRYHGDLEATGTGEMLTGGTEVQGSAVYVAVEFVSGSLQGRRGTFLLQHGGTMVRGAPSLRITVVPDSGTGELAGLTGEMDIHVDAGAHSYDFKYSLPGNP